MQFDDRLATVLRMQAGSAFAAGTQYRQLLDLVGSAPLEADHELLATAYAKLGGLSHEISAELRSSIVGEPSLRLRSPELVAFLAGQDLPTATAALAAARLDEQQWNALIPALPIPLRALLRERRDLPQASLKMLTDLGIGGLGLPRPGEQAEPGVFFTRDDLGDEVLVLGPSQELDSDAVLELDPALEIADENGAAIGALVKRIEAFQRARKSVAAAAPADSPRLPLGELPFDAPAAPHAFDFATDAEGRINWADPALAPMTVGMALASELPGTAARTDEAMRAAMRHRLPIRGGRAVLAGAPAIEGAWRVDAAPHFTVPTGRFTGYRGRMRRPVEAGPAPAVPHEDSADRVRMMLHELRTPVNAIQGFSEMIQQQVLGAVPNEYRALAATIAGDAARMLAGFEELDRLAKLESGALEPERGASDFRATVLHMATRLETVLSQRGAGLELDAPLAAHPVTLARHDAELLAWRLLATIAGAAAPGEALRLVLSSADGRVRLAIDLPATFAGHDDVFAGQSPARSQAVVSGMFGTGFTLRLARAEARAAGGDLRQENDRLVLALPRAETAPGENPIKPVD